MKSSDLRKELVAYIQKGCAPTEKRYALTLLKALDVFDAAHEWCLADLFPVVDPKFKTAVYVTTNTFNSFLHNGCKDAPKANPKRNRHT